MFNVVVSKKLFFICYCKCCGLISIYVCKIFYYHYYLSVGPFFPRFVHVDVQKNQRSRYKLDVQCNCTITVKSSVDTIFFLNIEKSLRLKWVLQIVCIQVLCTYKKIKNYFWEKLTVKMRSIVHIVWQLHWQKR